MLCPFGCDEGAGFSLLQLSDGHLWYHPDTIEHLATLAEHFELIWATAWEDHANEVLVEHFGLPPLPVITFGTERVDGRIFLPPVDWDRYESWKLPWIAEWAEQRDGPVAWIDDDARGDALIWASKREHATLVIKTDPTQGISHAYVLDLIRFAEEAKNGSP